MLALTKQKQWQTEKTIPSDGINENQMEKHRMTPASIKILLAFLVFSFFALH